MNTKRVYIKGQRAMSKAANRAGDTVDVEGSSYTGIFSDIDYTEEMVTDGGGWLEEVSQTFAIPLKQLNYEKAKTYIGKILTSEDGAFRVAQIRKSKISIILGVVSSIK